MRYINLNNISIFQMNLFITAGLELNYTRTAQLFHTTQPTVSRQIDALEKTLGIILFNKENGHLQLTPAGKSIHESFQQTLNQLQQNIQYAHEKQRGYNSFLNITIAPNVNSLKIHQPLDRAFSSLEENRHLRIFHHIEEWNEAVPHLLSYETDVIFTYYHNKCALEKYPQLECDTVISTPLTAMMLHTNPLSSRKSVTIQDLRNQRLLLPQWNENPNYINTVLEYYSRANVVPLVAFYSSSCAESLMNLAENDEILITDRMIQQYDASVMTCVDIEGTESGMLMVWRKNSQKTPFIQRYLSFAKNYLEGYEKYIL